MNRNRFRNEFKVVVANNWRQDLALLSIIFFSTVALLVALPGGLLGGAVGGTLAARAETALVLSSMIALVAVAYCAAMVFGDLSDRNVQISMMMNPSSVSEKFWTRMLHSFLMVTVLSELAAYAAVGLWLLFQADGVRMQVWEYLLGVKSGGNSLFVSVAGTPLMYVMSFVSSCSFVAAYAVGAVYFRRRPFLHTTLVIVAAFLVVLFSAGFLIGLYISVAGREAAVSHSPDARTLTIVLAVFFMVSCVLLLRWAYCRFSKLQYKTR